MTSIVDKIVELHRALDSHEIDHAFGGALALAWCTQRARGTIDIDLNVFVDQADVARVVEALPVGVTWTSADLATLVEDGQVRVRFDSVPVDLFCNTTDFHREAASRVRVEDFAGELVPFLGCDDLAVFKVFFNRARDWADLEEMARARTLDVGAVVQIVAAYLGADDPRIPRLLALTT